MSTADKARELVTESLIYKIEACNRQLDKTDELRRFGEIFKSRLLLLNRLEELVLRT